MQEAADDLVSLYKRVSLDDDLDDALRSELLSQLSAGSNPLLAMVFKPSIHIHMSHYFRKLVEEKLYLFTCGNIEDFK